MQGGPKRGSQHKSLVFYVAQESSEEESDTEIEREIAVENRCASDSIRKAIRD